MPAMPAGCTAAGARCSNTLSRRSNPLMRSPIYHDHHLASRQPALKLSQLSSHLLRLFAYGYQYSAHTARKFLLFKRP